MSKFAIIGLGAFGIRMLEELIRFTDQIIIIDKDPNVIKKYEHKAMHSAVIDIIDENSLRESIYQGIDTAIVDLGGKIELSIMVTTYLKKLGIREIVVKAENDQHEEVLSIVGATTVIFPDREAAKRVMPMLASTLLFNFMPLSSNLALAEVGVNTEYVGKTLLEANLRKNLGLNVVAVRKPDCETFNFINDPQYRFAADDILLLAGSEEHIFTFSRHKKDLQKKKGIGFFRSLFPRKN
ncbi:MAG: TrkA family potassium uptake protein [Treponema sp.]